MWHASCVAGHREHTMTANRQMTKPVPEGRHHTAALISHGGSRARRRQLGILPLTALGVVYGDIGTSPLYAFRACFGPQYGLPLTPPTVLGVLSLIVWSLIVIVTVKYVLVIL